MVRSADETPSATWVHGLAVRELFAALLKARRAVRLYPAGHALREVGHRELTRCARKVLRRGTVEAAIRDGRVICADRSAYVEPVGETLLGAFEAGGVHGLVISEQVTATDWREFVRRCAEPPAESTPEAVRAAWARGVFAAGLAGIEPRRTPVTA